jgi:hypothetical protein
MLLQIALLSEAFVAYVAIVRLHSRMPQHMNRQHVRPSERLSANLQVEIETFQYNFRKQIQFKIEIYKPRRHTVDD